MLNKIQNASLVTSLFEIGMGYFQRRELFKAYKSICLACSLYMLCVKFEKKNRCCLEGLVLVGKFTEQDPYFEISPPTA